VTLPIRKEMGFARAGRSILPYGYPEDPGRETGGPRGRTFDLHHTKSLAGPVDGRTTSNREWVRIIPSRIVVFDVNLKSHALRRYRGRRALLTA